MLQQNNINLMDICNSVLNTFHISLENYEYFHIIINIKYHFANNDNNNNDTFTNEANSRRISRFLKMMELKFVDMFSLFFVLLLKSRR